MYFEQPQLAQWDSAKNNWRLDTFTDTQYSEGIPPLNGFLYHFEKSSLKSD